MPNPLLDPRPVDPMAQLAQKVAALEQQVTAMATKRPALPTYPKVATWTSSATSHSRTYVANGGVVVVLASVSMALAQLGALAQVELRVDGTQRDTANIQEGKTDSLIIPSQVMAYSPGVWTGSHTIALNKTAGSASSQIAKSSIIVIELPYSGE